MNEDKIFELADFIKQYARDNNGESPSLAEITRMMGTSKSTAYRYVLELEKRGIVSYSGKNTLGGSLQRKMQCGYRKVPLAGQIVCGSPDEQEEYISGYLAIPEEWVDGECYLLRAYGDSMIDVGIFEDDLILVKKTSEATDGQIVVALTENGNTLKRLFWEEDGRPRLHAENKTYSRKKRDIYPKEMTVQGIALKVIRNIC
jgi:repressor LexA